MSKEMTVIVLGLLIAATPYLGVPGSWKTIILAVAGLGVATAGFLLRGEALSRSSTHNHFVENSAPAQPASRDHVIGSLN